MRVLLLTALSASLAPGPALSSDRYAARVLESLNAVRTHPGAMAVALRQYRRTFREHIAYEDEPGHGWGTSEGTAAVDEAAAVMDRQAALQPLSSSPVLARAARLHAMEQARTGALGHVSAASAGPGDRVRAAGGDIYVTEAIAYGFATPERAVRQLLVDDGVPRRGHRVVMLNPRLRYAGVGCAEHPRLRTVCVIDLAETFDGSPWAPAPGP